MDTNDQPTVAPTETTVAENVQATPIGNEQAIPVEEVMSESSATPLPGVISLIKSGFGIYKERMGALIGIGVLQFLTWAFILIPIVFSNLLRSNLMIGISVVLLSVLIGIWFYFWFLLTSMEIIRGHAQMVTLRQALRTTISKTLPFIWMLIMSFLIVIGTGTLLSILSSTIIASLGVLSGMHSFAIIVGGAAAGISWLVVAILFSIWFLFSYWVFVDEGERGVNALVASRELIRKNINAIFWRAFAATFLVYLAYYIVSMLSSFIFSVEAQNIVSIILDLISALFLVPIVLGIMYELFHSVKIRVGTEVQRNEKLHKYFKGYAIFGAVSVFLFVIAMFVAMFLMGGSALQTLMGA